MKTINLLLAGLILFGASCSNDEPTQEPTLKDKLIGKWIELYPCDSCRTFTFSKNDTVYQKSVWDETIYSSFYKVISSDSIMIIRNWDIEAEKKKTSHKIVFMSSDTINIIQFLPVDVGITGFEDVILTKSE
jgi:hypothetical protein